MKRTLKKIGLHKPESERTSAQKLIRDAACFSVVIVAAVLGYFYGVAEVNLMEAECDSAQVTIEHLVACSHGL